MIQFLVFALLVILYLLLMRKAGRTFPILYLFIFMYFIQYIFSTYLIYNEYKVLSYQMPIGKEQYFNYVVPAFIALFAGVFLFDKRIDLRSYLQRIEPQQASQLGYLLLLISIFFDGISWLGIDSFDSIISFTTYLKYLAAFCFLFTRSLFNHVLIGLIYAQLGVFVLQSGVFISFFIWTIFLLFFLSLKYAIPFSLRILFFVVFVPVVVLIQGVKGEYREKIWMGREEGGVGLLSDLAEKQSRKENGSFTESSSVISTVGRLSQGWHLGMTLRHVPAKEPIAEGREMLIDVVSSFLPRIIFADKQSVNSQAKFKRYTGHRLRGSTSMSIGILGDFYINYGWWGSLIMLFLFGVVIAKLLHYFMIRFVLPDPINVIWIPFLFSYLIRANNDFYIFFNCLVKGFLIFVAVNYLRYHLLGARKPIIRINKASIS